LIVELWKSYK